jgi:biopolymer transport protein ExbD
MKLKPRRTEEPEINLISLIDVVLMIVIFFMLSSTFVDENRLRIRLPEASASPLSRGEGEPLVVAVTQGGGYRINDRELINSSAETLRAAILKVAPTDRAQPVTVRADGRATHQSVVTAMDVLGRLGFREINIATVGSQASPGAGTTGARGAATAPMAPSGAVPAPSTTPPAAEPAMGSR